MFYPKNLCGRLALSKSKSARLRCRRGCNGRISLAKRAVRVTCDIANGKNL